MDGPQVRDMGALQAINPRPHKRCVLTRPPSAPLPLDRGRRIRDRRAMNPADALKGLGGVAEVRTLRNAGVGKVATAQAVSAGTIERVRRGCYALPDADPAAVAALAWHGVPTCVTALEQLGLPVPASYGIHLAFPATRSFSGRNSRPPSTVLPHYFDRPLPWGTAAVIDVASRCLNEEDHLIAVDAALHGGTLSRGEIEQFVRCSAKRKRFLLKYCDGRAESPPETLARLALMRSGIWPDCQVWIPGIGRVDMLIDGGLIVEIDGEQYHIGERAFKDDRRRDRAAQLADLMVLRYPGSIARFNAPLIVAEVKSALSNGPFAARTASPQVKVKR